MGSTIYQLVQDFFHIPPDSNKPFNPTFIEESSLRMSTVIRGMVMVLICSIPFMGQWATLRIRSYECCDNGATLTWQSLGIVLQCATKNFDIVKELLFDLGCWISVYLICGHSHPSSYQHLISFRSSWSKVSARESLHSPM